MLRWSFWGGWGFVMVVGCASTERAPAPPRAQTGGGAAPANKRSAEPAPAPVAAEPLRRDSAAGSTVGTIACGAMRCRAGSEVCIVVGASWSCAPATSQQTGYYACDDASDCAAPLTCCLSFASAEEIYDCAKPREDCAALLCAGPDGTPCPPGLHCDGGVCMADWRATCGEGKRCPQEAPYCAWSSSPACVPDSSGIPALGQEGSLISGIYECTKPTDCGGAQECCTSFLEAERVTRCFHQCDPSNSARLCERDADCQDRALLWCEDDDECRRTVRCAAPSGAAASTLPPWLKVCQRPDQ